MTVHIKLELSELDVLALGAGIPDGAISCPDEADPLEARAVYALQSMVRGVIAPICATARAAYVAGNHDLRDWPQGEAGSRIIQ